MNYKYKKVTFYTLSILVMSAGIGVYSISLNNKKASVDQGPVLNKNISLLSNTSSISPEIDGHVSEGFIHRFNKAISLNSDETKFIINKNLIPYDASEVELKQVNKLVNQANINLQSAHQLAPAQDIERVGNSVVVANSPETAKVVADQLNGTTLTTVSKYHNGSTYIHHYWWGYRVGISKKDLHRASLGLNAASLFPYDKWIPLGWVVSVAAGIAGIAADVAPGGIVFNYSGIPGSVYGTIWSVGFQ